jgi:MOSC domain-containing protein YiiM
MIEIVSVNVGLPREVEWKGRIVTTGIFKAPVADRVLVRTLNLDGDRQADLQVHGGPNKAVYAYAAEHYDWWRQEVGDPALGWGAFGENLTTRGLIEADVNVGDEFRAGSALLRAVQPRLPCFKLGLRFGDEGMVKRFLRAGRYGIYFAVVEEGTVAAGDPIERVFRDPRDLKVVDIARLYVSDKRNTALMQRAVDHPALPLDWRDYFRERIGKLR